MVWLLPHNFETYVHIFFFLQWTFSYSLDSGSDWQRMALKLEKQKRYIAVLLLLYCISQEEDIMMFWLNHYRKVSKYASIILVFWRWKSKLNSPKVIWHIHCVKACSTLVYFNKSKLWSKNTFFCRASVENGYLEEDKNT